ncbi:hypothetical protein LQF12_09880 [Ruania suaedae]|nr:hypothetical protein [Ruania suaedae]UFU01825.1 hypothetical protein LQF12_09880 [Ruania suaedae]
MAAIEHLVISAGSRVYDFDAAAASAYAALRTEGERRGRPGTTEDLMIAGICQARGATLATRNVRDLAGSGLDLLDPWQQEH